MKNFLSVFTLMLLVIINVSCNKTKDKLTEFDIDYSTSLTIPASSYTVNVPADFSTPQIPTESASKFTSQKTTQNLIDEIKMTRFNISTASGNLDALKSISIYLKTSDLGDILIATKTDIPQNVMSTSADLKDVNIKEYIFKDKIQFRVTLTITAGSAATQLKMDQTMHVKATLIK